MSRSHLCDTPTLGARSWLFSTTLTYAESEHPRAAPDSSPEPASPLSREPEASQQLPIHVPPDPLASIEAAFSVMPVLTTALRSALLLQAELSQPSPAHDATDALHLDISPQGELKDETDARIRHLTDQVRKLRQANHNLRAMLRAETRPSPEPLDRGGGVSCKVVTELAILLADGRSEPAEIAGRLFDEVEKAQGGYDDMMGGGHSEKERLGDLEAMLALPSQGWRVWRQWSKG